MGIETWAVRVRKAWEEEQRMLTERYYGNEEIKEATVSKPKVDKFATGATRDVSEAKVDYEGFISPVVTKAFGMFMHYNRELEDGSLRASDNWQLGIPLDNYIKSLVRHVEDLRLHHRGHGEQAEQTLSWTLGAIMFNAQGYWLEVLKKQPNRAFLDRIVETKAREERRARAKRMAELG